MAIVRMQKIRLFVHTEDARALLEAVQKAGAVEMHELDPSDTAELTRVEKKSFDWNHRSGRLDFAVSFLTRYETPVSGFAQKFRRMIEGARVETTDKDIEGFVKSFDFDTIVDKAERIEGEQNRLEAQLRTQKDHAKLLDGWSDAELHLEDPLTTKHTRTFLLAPKAGANVELNDFLQEIQSVTGGLAHATQLSDDKVMVTSLSADRANVLEKAGEFSFETISLPEGTGTIREAHTKLLGDISNTEKALSTLNKDATLLAENLPTLKMLADHAYWKKEVDDMAHTALGTKDVLVFEGWAPALALPKLEADLAQASPLFSLEKIKARDGEVPPVDIKNGTAIAPFEAVTKLYGLPGHRDLDPTLFLSGFFFIFFGLSLTDVGYGLTLFLLTAFVLYTYRVPASMKPLISLLMVGGASAVIMGALFGGYLGVDMKFMPEIFQKIQLFDPIASPMSVLALSLAFGVIQILLGLTLRIVSEAKQGNLWGGVLDQGPWMLTIISLVLLAGNMFGVLEGDGGVYTAFVWASLASIVLTQGRTKKTIVGKFFGGLVGLYDSIGYFSDILSYSRLLALGLATSALAFAVNLIAFLVRDMVPVIGPLLMVGILIVGHIFNLAINILGAFIHSARLQFVEFFGKFILGTGRDFKAFKREERNVVLTDL